MSHRRRVTSGRSELEVFQPRATRRNSSRSILALYGVLRGSTGRFSARVQVLALFFLDPTPFHHIQPVFSNRGWINAIQNALIRAAGHAGDVSVQFVCEKTQSRRPEK